MTRTCKHDRTRDSVLRISGIIGVALVLAAFVVGTGFAGDATTMKGNIAQVDKYRVTQMTNEDVVLDRTEVNDLIQDDEVLKALRLQLPLTELQRATMAERIEAVDEPIVRVTSVGYADIKYFDTDFNLSVQPEDRAPVDQPIVRATSSVGYSDIKFFETDYNRLAHQVDIAAVEEPIVRAQFLGPAIGF